MDQVIDFVKLSSLNKNIKWILKQKITLHMLFIVSVYTLYVH